MNKKIKNLKTDHLKNIINATDDDILKQAIKDIEERLPSYIMEKGKNSVVIWDFTEIITI